VTITVSRATSKAVSANGRLSFEVALAPGEAWHVCLLYMLEDREQQLRAPHDCVGESHKSRLFLTMAEWLKTVVKIETSNEEFYRLFHQALEDMAALRLPIKDTDHMVFLPAAGLPSARRQQEQVLIVASNPGHCLWCGIVPRERAKKVVDRLMAPDMWTGWGIRTLSADHRAQCHHRHGVQILWL
jgi:hypothetical protein